MSRRRAVSHVSTAVLACGLAMACTGGQSSSEPDLLCAWAKTTHHTFVCGVDELPQPVDHWANATSEPLDFQQGFALVDVGAFACVYRPAENYCQCDALCGRSMLNGALLCHCGFGSWTDQDEFAQPFVVEQCAPEAEFGGVCCEYDAGCVCKSDEYDCAFAPGGVEVASCDPPQVPAPGTVSDDGAWQWVRTCGQAPWPHLDPGGDDDGGTAGGDDGGAPGQTADGEPCQDDADCRSGSKCMPSLALADGPRECGPPCALETFATDCDALTQLDYYIAAPYSPNEWNSGSLSRGNTCGDSGYCQYVCPPNAAIMYDDQGNPSGCSCLPHFANAGTECVWNEGVECAMLQQVGEPNPCDACNSDVLYDNCPTGRYECYVDGPRFEGTCVEWATIEDLDACISGGAGYDCDPACYQSCTNAACGPDFCNTEGCLDLCCQSTGEPPTGDGSTCG